MLRAVMDLAEKFKITIVVKIEIMANINFTHVETKHVPIKKLCAQSLVLPE